MSTRIAIDDSSLLQTRFAIGLHLQKSQPLNQVPYVKLSEYDRHTHLGIKDKITATK